MKDYAGIPYRPRGRTKAGCDCYGLVRLVLREEFGKELPEYGDYHDLSPRDMARLIHERIPLVAGRRVNNPEPGDIVLMRIRGVPCHVGVFIGDRRMIHTLYPHDSVIERVDSIKWASYIEGYYRV